VERDSRTAESSRCCWTKRWGKISKLTEELAVTAELSVEYRMPVPLTEEILVEGWQESEKGRNRFRIGEIKDAAGNLLARGRGRFVVVGQRPA